MNDDVKQIMVKINPLVNIFVSLILPNDVHMSSAYPTLFTEAGTDSDDRNNLNLDVIFSQPLFVWSSKSPGTDRFYNLQLITIVKSKKVWSVLMPTVK